VVASNLPPGWGQGKPMKAKRPSSFKLVTFKGGPIDGQTTRWHEELYPPFWDHVVRHLEPISEGSPIPKEGVVAGEGRAPHPDIEGETVKVLLYETRVLYRYQRTVTVSGEAQVYDMQQGPVPVEWDKVEGRWKHPLVYGRTPDSPLSGDVALGDGLDGGYVGDADSATPPSEDPA